jgi:hypothetical protein
LAIGAEIPSGATLISPPTRPGWRGARTTSGSPTACGWRSVEVPDLLVGPMGS